MSSGKEWKRGRLLICARIGRRLDWHYLLCSAALIVSQNVSNNSPRREIGLVAKLIRPKISCGLMDTLTEGPVARNKHDIKYE